MNVGTAFTDVYFLVARYSAVTLTKNTSNVMKNKSEEIAIYMFMNKKILSRFESTKKGLR